MVCVSIYTHIQIRIPWENEKITVFPHICVFIRRYYSKTLILTKKAAFLGNLRKRKNPPLYT